HSSNRVTLGACDYKAPTSNMSNADASMADELNIFKAAAIDANAKANTNASGCRQEENANTEKAFIISEHDVRRAFRRVNTSKAAGPDGISGRVLRACADQLILDTRIMFYVKMLFVDYSSAFNTIIPSALTTKLQHLGLCPSLTGAPQGCVLSPLLYSLHTYDCVATTNSTTIIKFADDTVVVGLISDNNETAYLEDIRNLENWCKRNNLLLNVSKTRELIVDFSTKQERNNQTPVINESPVERVDSFRYLSVHITQDLSWSCHINTVVKKARQRLYHLRRLRDFRLPSKAVPLWALSLPLPAIILISVGLYMLFLAGVLWCHHCLKTQCNPQCTNCCPSVSPFEYCHMCAQSCDCRPPSLHTCLDHSCPSPNCAMWDCTCTPQPPQCDSINCLCCEIKFK
ncbi:hypothetical protein QTP86_031764, partial [Hemibagrus guttatus]